MTNQTASPLGIKDESDKQRVKNYAAEHGIEIAGEYPEDHRIAIEQHLEPVVIVDCLLEESSEDCIKQMSESLDVADNNMDDIGNDTRMIREGLIDNGLNLAFLRFDTLPDDAQQSLAQLMKGIMEGVTENELLLAFSSRDGGAVTHAEPDLRGRIRRYDIENSVVETPDPLSRLRKGDVIETSERDSTMTVESVYPAPTVGLRMTATNQYGKYRFSSHRDGTMTMRTPDTLISDDARIEIVERRF